MGLPVACTALPWRRGRAFPEPLDWKITGSVSLKDWYARGYEAGVRYAIAEYSGRRTKADYVNETYPLERRKRRDGIALLYPGAQARVLKAPLRGGRYLMEVNILVTPRISVEAFQERSIPVCEMPVILRSVGAAGGTVSLEFPGISAT